MHTYLKHQIQADQFGARFLETDGAGSFISFTATNANVRNDDSLFTYSLTAPIRRYKLVQKFDEQLIIDDSKYDLSSQTYVNDKRNTDASNYILKFEFDLMPTWTYQCCDVTIIKRLVFSNESRQIAIQYQVINPFNRQVTLNLVPQIAGHLLGTYKSANEYDYAVEASDEVVSFISPTAEDLHIKSELSFELTKQVVISDYYYGHDARDGRDAIGSSASYGQFKLLTSDQTATCSFILSIENKFEQSVDQLIGNEVTRKQLIIANSNTHSEFSKRLALATDNFLVHRQSTNNKTIIAGYPFFGDWGRDTFWALYGTCIETNRLDDAKSILRSFVEYQKNGLIPNMFPEGDEYPFYNSVDAPLLFINSVYEYYLASNDDEFLTEVTPTIQAMINHYIKGTDYHIKMDSDGLISSGADLEQLTWMDVRFDTILPTPRQGKCVEINAMWYNALSIVNQLQITIDADLDQLIKLVKSSFRTLFITEDGYLRDVISQTEQDNQIRSNQIWAITQHFTPLEADEIKQVIKIASRHLFAGVGIRTLSPTDQAFKPKYGDSHFERDMAYHQGTVWPFIFGGYIRAYLKSENYSQAAKVHAEYLLSHAEQNLNEYCLGQICEVADGLHPSISKGCYAQAWSIAEIYRAVCEVERI